MDIIKDLTVLRQIDTSFDLRTDKNLVGCASAIYTKIETWQLESCQMLNRFPCFGLQFFFPPPGHETDPEG